MTSLWKIAWPVVTFAVLSVISGLFVENPTYTVSPVHTCLVFLLASASLFYVRFSNLRQSHGSYTCGTVFGFLALVSALLPDLWLRWPAHSLLGLGIANIGAFVASKALKKSPGLRSFTVVLICVLSTVPVALTVYVSSPENIRVYLAAAGVLFSIINAWMAWSRRQRVSLMGILSWLLVTVLVGALLFFSFNNWTDFLEHRQQFELFLLFGLLFAGATFVAEMLQIEKHVRSGPHMELDASFRDPLTNLANRRALEMFGPRLITQSHQAGRAVSIIIADIDHFKQINDTHGHLAGDTVLKHTATKLSSQVRKSDLVSRYGGEEFVIVLPGSPLAPALRLAERMRAALEQETVYHENTALHRTASFGVATAFPEEPASLFELIQRADTNLYRAKHKGRNLVMADALPASDF